MSQFDDFLGIPSRGDLEAQMEYVFGNWDRLPPETQADLARHLRRRSGARFVALLIVGFVMFCLIQLGGGFGI